MINNKPIIENLTVEPNTSSQMEIAVRFPHVDGHTHIYKYSGYRINSLGTLTGFDTNGH